MNEINCRMWKVTDTKINEYLSSALRSMVFSHAVVFFTKILMIMPKCNLLNTSEICVSVKQNGILSHKCIPTDKLMLKKNETTKLLSLSFSPSTLFFFSQNNTASKFNCSKNPEIKWQIYNLKLIFSMVKRWFCYCLSLMVFVVIRCTRRERKGLSKT